MPFRKRELVTEGQDTPKSMEEVHIEIPKELDAAVEHLLAKSSEGLAAIEELKGTMEQIAAAAEENAGASEESLSTIDAIRKNAKVLEEESVVVIEIAQRFQDLLDNVAQTVLESSEGMHKAALSAEEIANRAEELYHHSEAIGSATSLITKLAKKISLLALNAAIEATKAKEQGKFFSIMASEIRAIATKTNDYVEAIVSIVEQIQEKIDFTKETMDRLRGDMEANAKEGAKSKEIIAAMVEEMRHLMEMTQGLVAMVKDVAASVEKLHKNAETIAAAAEESASAVSEITTTIANNANAFAQAEQAAKMIHDMVQSDKENQQELVTAAEELSGSNEELLHSMEQVVEALEQIEEAAHIAIEDAKKGAQIVHESLANAQKAKERIEHLRKTQEKIKQELSGLVEIFHEIREKSKKNLTLSEGLKKELTFIRTRIVKLNHTIRKIELSTVQISALSINGSVEAMRAGELGGGFSEVSKDIKQLAEGSEENLDKVLETIDTLQQENDVITVDLNNITLTQLKEGDRLQRLEFELSVNQKSLARVEETIEGAYRVIEEIFRALEESKIAVEQIVEAAELSLKNAQESKEAAKIIRQIALEMKSVARQVYELASSGA